ncbi:restriction endonuclease subunit S [Xanthomonas oryzae]|uniref:restriction endonuclease subunit S n=1 Tax=Xanthomonas oryzae TaxID=347 RepID=UPI002ED4E314|nr:restriction endonuclease subunit S [Xanthomonas oryzae pv. oryzicola]
MSELPAGWSETEIGSINTYRSETLDPAKSPKQTFELYSVPIFPKRKPEVVEGRDIGSTKQKVEPDDVLLCKINPRINRVWVVGKKNDHEQIASSEWIVIRQPLFDPAFIRLQLQEPSFRERLCAEVSGVGGSLTRAQPKKVEGYKLRIAPLAEQKRIAQKLDALLAQVDTLKARIDAIPTLLKRFRRSVLTAALSGELTEQWRNDHPQEDWVSVKIGSICKLKSGVAISADHEKSAGDAPYFKVGEMNRPGNELFLQHTDRYLMTADAPSRAIMPRGSILFPKRGGAIATNKKRVLKEPSFVDLNIMGIIVPDGVEVMYVYRWLETIDLGKLNTGSTIPQVNNSDIAPLLIPIPSREEQTEIVRRVEQLFAYADQLEAKVAAAQQRIDALTQSLLAKAFRGELVPQDPTDEPASVLLERIRTQRAAAPKPKRGRKAATS